MNHLLVLTPAINIVQTVKIPVLSEEATVSIRGERRKSNYSDESLETYIIFTDVSDLSFVKIMNLYSTPNAIKDRPL